MLKPCVYIKIDKIRCVICLFVNYVFDTIGINRIYLIILNKEELNIIINIYIKKNELNTK